MSLLTWSGQEISVFVEAIDADTTRIVVGGRRDQRGNPFGGGGQIVGWGEKGMITRQFFEALVEVLPEIPEPAPVVPAAAAPTTTAELERLAALHERGALTDEEFGQAKAQLLNG